MKIFDYVDESAKTAIYPHRGEMGGLAYVSCGLAGETGELFEVLKKVLRDNDGQFTPTMIDRVKKEAGDILWYWSQFLFEISVTSDEDDTLSNTFQEELFKKYIGDNERTELDDPSLVYQQMYLLNPVQRSVAEVMDLVVNIRTSDDYLDANESLKIHSINIFKGICIFLSNMKIRVGEVMQMNIDKLTARMEVDKIKGDGEELDDR